ncbi:metallophosphoesterase [Agrobacterium rhizogenes]|nr:metallophosphoesterase [Rhizobium rhizogenes]
MIVAQATDIHAQIDNNNLSRFEKSIAWLAELKPDCLVVSGDLVDDGWAEGYSRLGDILRSLPCRSLVLPGNSDDKSVMRSILKDFVGGASPGQLHFAERFDSMLLLGLDSTVDGASYGDIGDHLPWLQKKLDEARDSTAMLFLHHHVVPSGIEPIDELMCRGKEALAELLAQNPHLLAVSAGHVHRPISGTIAGRPGHVCGSTCPANPLFVSENQCPPVTDPSALMVHMIASGTVISHHVSV